MSSDVVAVAIAGGISTVSVALIGGLANMFGATWRETRASRDERVAREQDLRFERAQNLSTAAYDRSESVGSSAIANLAGTRIAFAAVLRKGEQPVADFVTRELARIKETSRDVECFTDDLFSYLRGDLTLADMGKEATTRRRNNSPT